MIVTGSSTISYIHSFLKICHILNVKEFLRLNFQILHHLRRINCGLISCILMNDCITTTLWVQPGDSPIFLIIREIQFLNIRKQSYLSNSTFSDIPKDSLDIVLASEYDHATDFLFKRAEVFTQPETLDKRTFRRLKNQKDIVIKPPVPMSHPKTQGFISFYFSC